MWHNPTLLDTVQDEKGEKHLDGVPWILRRRCAPAFQHPTSLRVYQHHVTQFTFLSDAVCEKQCSIVKKLDFVFLNKITILF